MDFNRILGWRFFRFRCFINLHDEVCVVDLAKVLLTFSVESCGKCNPCRIGSQRAFNILTNISEGVGSLHDLDDLKVISQQLYELSNRTRQNSCYAN